MNKSMAIHQFWSSFGWTAINDDAYYGEQSKPDFPYITYSIATDSLDRPVDMNASLWDRAGSWQTVADKAEEISEYIEKMYPPSIPIDNGRIYITRGRPFAQRMGDPDDNKIKRIYLNIQVEYLTAY